MLGRQKNFKDNESALTEKSRFRISPRGKSCPMYFILGLIHPSVILKIHRLDSWDAKSTSIGDSANVITRDH